MRPGRYDKCACGQRKSVSSNVCLRCDREARQRGHLAIFVCQGCGAAVSRYAVVCDDCLTGRRAYTEPVRPDLYDETDARRYRPPGTARRVWARICAECDADRDQKEGADYGRLG